PTNGLPVSSTEVIQAVPVREPSESGSGGERESGKDRPSRCDSQEETHKHTPVKRDGHIHQTYPLVCDRCMQHTSEATRQALASLSSTAATSLSPLVHINTFYKGCRAATEASRALVC
ncbi:hypothetical protein KIPB_015379, partial [Kipferlia bialata]